MSEQRIEEMRQQWSEETAEIEAIRDRAASEYRHESGEQYTPMLRDIRALLRRLNIVSEFWESAEKEVLDGRASTISEAVEKVREMEAANKRNYEYWKAIASDPTDLGVMKFLCWAGEDSRVIAVLESLQPSGVVLVSRDAITVEEALRQLEEIRPARTRLKIDLHASGPRYAVVVFDYDVATVAFECSDSSLAKLITQVRAWANKETKQDV